MVASDAPLVWPGERRRSAGGGGGRRGPGGWLCSVKGDVCPLLPAPPMPCWPWRSRHPQLSAAADPGHSARWLRRGGRAHWQPWPASSRGCLVRTHTGSARGLRSPARQLQEPPPEQRANLVLAQARPGAGWVRPLLARPPAAGGLASLPSAWLAMSCGSGRRRCRRRAGPTSPAGVDSGLGWPEVLPVIGARHDALLSPRQRRHDPIECSPCSIRADDSCLSIPLVGGPRSGWGIAGAGAAA